MKRMKRPIINSKWLFAMLLIVVLGGCMRTTTSDVTTLPLTWDVSDGHQLERVGWSLTQGSDTFHLSDVEVTLKISDSVTLENWNAGNVYVTQNLQQPTQIRSIMLRTKSLTLEEAYVEALRLADIMALPKERIERWHQERLIKEQAGFEQVNFIAARNDLNPALSLESAVSFNDEKPWILSLEIFWQDGN